jgi:nucleoside-diphosphate-sugar epimerase
MNEQMQTILGSGGPIGVELAKALSRYTNEIRLVSRKPEKVNATDEIFAADVLDAVQLENAVRGSAIVYVTVGFHYSYKTWKAAWPTFIRNLLAICEKEGCKLVFFDNVYMYDQNSLNPMTERSPVNPSSKKGEIRAMIAETIMEKAKAGKVKALIARSADFYGPSIQQTSLLIETVFKPLSTGKTANWMASDKFKHSFTYTTDAARATALLGNTENAFGEVWHLPTASNPLTGRQWVEMVAKKLGVAPKHRVVSKLIVRLMGLFMPLMKEFVEMLYQYDRDYVFDSSKFEKQFGLKPTSYEEGIDEIIAADYGRTTVGKNFHGRTE